MTRPAAIMAVLAIAVALVLTPASVDAGPGASQAADRTSPRVAPRPVPPGRVVVVTIPRLGWDDIDAGTMPNLVALADRGGVASLSVKTFGRHTERGAGYATLGAGTRATAPHASASGARSAAGPSGRIVVPDLEDVAAANDRRREGAVPGALGTALRQAGRRTVVVANHDGPDGRDRAATLGIVDETGEIDAGSVSRRLTLDAGSSEPRTDGDQLLVALDALEARDVALVEIGDVDWAESVGGRRAAVRRSDELLGALLDQFDLQTDLVIVLAPVAPHGPRDQPTPFVMAGAGTTTGWARSASTRLEGHVTLPDVAPTILDRIGADIPASMSGTPITTQSSGTAASSGLARIAAARDEIAEVRFIDGAAGRLLSTIPIVFACWSLLALLLTLVPPGAFERLLRGFVRWVALVQIALPGVTFAGAAWTVRSWGQPWWAVAMWGSACVLGAGAALLDRRPARAPIVLAAATWLLLVGDLLTGGRLQFIAALGNSPTVAGRFAGIGNLAFGLLAGTAILVAIAAHRMLLARTGSDGWALVGAASVFVVTVAVDGAPGLGSDVGGVLTLVPAAAATLALLAPRRPRPVEILAASVAATVAVVGALVLVDRRRAPGDESHLARFTDRIGSGGAGETLARKADAALSSVTGSSLVWISVCTLIAIGLLWAFARPVLAAHLANRWSRAAWTGGATACLLGAALNDSGVMVPAMILVVLVPTAAHVLLRPSGPFDRSVGG